jgi:cytochrome o ubiquinol oxidase subunit 2
MAGMVTRLHLLADQPGTYRGISANYSGEGFSDMHFSVDAVPAESFARWLDAARGTGAALDGHSYADLAKPSKAVAPFTYRAVAPDLFNDVVSSVSASTDPTKFVRATSQGAEQ